jgi:hypothetical protein
MKVISSEISRRFWKKLDSWLLNLEALPARQALEDARAYAVFFNALAASQEIRVGGDLIERFDQAASRTALDTCRESEGPGCHDSWTSSEESEGEFLCRYIASFQPLWWHWVFYPIRSARVARVSKADVPAPQRPWLAEATEADLRVLEFGTLTPSKVEANGLRLAIDALGVSSLQLSKACRSMALSSMKNGLKRRKPIPFLTMLCRLGRDACVALVVLCAVGAFHAVKSDPLSATLPLISLAGLAVPIFVAGCLLNELGPKWAEADKLMTQLNSEEIET